jgi:hypothetical protein
MVINRIYYSLKPLLPWSFRIAIRRKFARFIRWQNAKSWPIDRNAGQPPRSWHGWPEKKKFALILTHDVEGPIGMQKCALLAQVECELGFRSAFYFIPEGTYNVPSQLRDELVSIGFEVGVHDLKHDGKLYLSKKAFEKNAKRINYYLKSWNAVGFRSGLMHHNLEWIKELNILYDLSTFDTDPFEPQPDGVGTIFPFPVFRHSGSFYVELPYTLLQDFTLFIVLREASIDIWKYKLDWIVKQQGMALINVHPDYMNFGDSNISVGEYSADLYRQFLIYIKENYAGLFWHATPKDAAEYIASQQAKSLSI